MKNSDLNKKIYLQFNHYNIKIERFLIELYYREVIDYLVEYSVTENSTYFENGINIVSLDDFLKDINDCDVSYKNHLLNLII